MKHTPGPWHMKPGDPDIREGWSIEAPDSPHPFGEEYVREDNVVGKCCSAGVYREEDARLICAAPELLKACWRALDALGEDRTSTDRREAEREIHAAINLATQR